MARVDGQYALRLLVESYGAQMVISWLWNLAAERDEVIYLPSPGTITDVRR